MYILVIAVNLNGFGISVSDFALFTITTKLSDKSFPVIFCASMVETICCPHSKVLISGADSRVPHSSCGDGEEADLPAGGGGHGEDHRD